jgi:dCMP deaminase
LIQLLKNIFNKLGVTFLTKKEKKVNNLIAYVPVINRQYLDWLKKHQPFHLFLISQKIAESLMPRLARNLVSLSIQDVRRLLIGAYWNSDENNVSICDFKIGRPSLLTSHLKDWIMPDEDVSCLFAEKYIKPKGHNVKFEQIWARWDMTAVKRQEPIIPDLEISSDEKDKLAMIAAQKYAKNSPDWWRQVGAMAFRDGKMIACAFNKHYPTEYETVIFSDLRINFDAGDPSGAEVYLSLHAEKGIVTSCARDGISLKGASVYVTTFPCGDCARMLADCQIKELFFQEGYSVLKGFETFKAAGVRIVKINT